MAATETAVFKVFIKGKPEDVWREITKTHEPQACFFNMQLHTTGLSPGGRMQMRSKSGKYVGAVGEVLEFDPPRRYAHTFRFTSNDDPPCRIVYELFPKDGGTEFVMTLHDLPAGAKSTKQMKQGGTMICNVLKSVVETGRVPLGSRLLFLMFALLEPLQPAKLKTEKWPL